MKKYYNKPSAQFELFSLDSEFASGGCTTVNESSTIVNYQMVVSEQALEYYLDNGALDIGTYMDFAEYAAEKGYGDMQSLAELSVRDERTFLGYVDEWVVNSNPSQFGFPTDDSNSKTCYFTFISPTAKTFS